MNNQKMLITIFLLTVTTALFAQNSTPVKPAVVEYGPSVTLEMAQRLINAARVESVNNGWTMAIAIVDTGGNLVAFEKMDNTQVASVELAIGKAKTANGFKRSSKLLEDAVAGGGIGLRLLSVPGMIPLEGGEPIIVNGKIIGAIGISGMQSTQDGQVARAALNEIKK